MKGHQPWICSGKVRSGVIKMKKLLENCSSEDIKVRKSPNGVGDHVESPRVTSGEAVQPK